MTRIFRYIFIITFLIFYTSIAFSQVDNVSDTTSNNSSDGIVRILKTDTVYPDTVIYNWKYQQNSFVKLFAKFDTTQIELQFPESFRKDYAGFVYLGNLGTAVRSTSFYERQLLKTNWLLKNFIPYLAIYDNHNYYNTKTPFTQLHYASAGKDWEYFSFLHTQNVNKHVNVAMEYKIFSSTGYLIQQETRNRNFSLSTDVDYNKYKVYASINFNGLDVNENGGIVSDYLLRDSVVDISNMNVKLNGANNHYKYFNAGLSQKIKLFGLGKDTIKTRTVWLEHYFSVDKTQRQYVDDESNIYLDPASNTNKTFYDNKYNGSSTNDTCAIIDFKNRLAISYSRKKEYDVYIGPYLEHHHKYYSNLLRDTLFTYNNDTSYQTFALGGLAGIKQKNDFAVDFQWTFDPFKGYNYKNYMLVGNFVKWQKFNNDTAYIHLQLSHRKNRVDYFLNHYYSNHFKWVNNFKDISEDKLQANVNLLNSRLIASFMFNNMNNYVYIDTAQVLSQSAKSIRVYGIKLEKKITFLKYFNFNFSFLGQFTNTNIIDVPLISFKDILFLRKNIHFQSTGGDMLINTGFNFWINSPYYAPAYLPALAQFYQQRNKKIGNYPNVDFFISARIKTFVAFLRFEHINSLSDKYTYYSAYGYPLRPFNVKFGINWNFYK